MLSIDTRSSVTSYLINIPIGCNIFDRCEVDRTIEKICNRLLQDPFFKSNTRFRLVVGLNQSNRDFMLASCVDDKDKYVARMLEHIHQSLQTRISEIADRVRFFHYRWNDLSEQKQEPSTSEQVDFDQKQTHRVNYSDIRNQLFLSVENKRMFEALKAEGGEEQDIIYMTMDPDTTIKPSQLHIVEEKFISDQARGLLIAGYYQFIIKHPELIQGDDKLVWADFLIDQHQAFDTRLKKLIADREFAIVLNSYTSIEEGSISLMKELARSNLAILRTCADRIKEGMDASDETFIHRKKEIPILEALCKLYVSFLDSSSDEININDYQTTISSLERELLNEMPIPISAKTQLSDLGKKFSRLDAQSKKYYFPFDQQAYFRKLAEQNIVVLELKQKELGSTWLGASELGVLIENYKKFVKNQFDFFELMALSACVEKLCEKWQDKKIDIPSLSVFWSIPGSSLLYPPEPVLFMLLYKKRQTESLDIFKEIETNQDGLWGKRGQGEGQELALRITQIWKSRLRKSPLLSLDLQPIHFSTSYRTKLPRRFKQGSRLSTSLAQLPQTLESLREKINDRTEREQLIGELRKCHRSLLQSSLSDVFLSQRGNFFKLEESQQATKANDATQAASSSRAQMEQREMRVFPKEHLNQLFRLFRQYYLHQQDLIEGQAVRSTLLAIEKALGLQSQADDSTSKPASSST